MDHLHNQYFADKNADQVHLMKRSFFTLLFVYCLAVQAQPSALNDKVVQNLGEHLFGPGQALYPSALANTGAQGTAVIEGVAHPGGTLSGLKVVKTSRSAALDRNALVLVKIIDLDMKKTLAEPMKFTVSIVFMRDSLETLKEKPCSDFIADYDYFTKTFPELPSKKMPLIGYASGILLLAKMDAYKALMAREEAVIASAVARCRAHPENRFMATFVREIG
ncbi:TonB family protein [Massilia glaciei]|uniref:TonB family protein n=1 Tax=Massilia glaciei TaxID=1524097 RepID=A0A2U2HDG6_9BURK|nr:TonB family protein [Massilia glaciei]PWF40988.1 TonB family protein [Massilia glaciei]